MNSTKGHELVLKGPYLNVKRFVLLRKDPDESYINLYTAGSY